MEDPRSQASAWLFAHAPARMDREWFVLRTKSRQEKALADDLETLRIAHFLPLIRVVRFYGGRKAKVQVPLFPGYVFVRGGATAAYQAERTRRVVQIIEVADQVRLHNELKNIALAISRNVALDTYPYLKKGVRVEVRSGPLRGLEGFVLDRDQRNRLILNVETLGTAVSVEIDPSLVDLLE
jgi:transcription antitermination factor NusG